MVTVKIPSSGADTYLNYSFRYTCSDVDFQIENVPEWLTGSVLDNSILFQADDNESGNERSAYLTPVVNGKKCNSKKIQVIQEGSDIPAPTCARGTDNGTDVVNGVKYSHPMLLCAIAYTDSDSTYVENLFYNGSLLTSSWVTVNDWLEIRRDTDGSGSVCGYGWIHYKATKNDTSSARTATLKFSTTDTEVCADSPVYKAYGIKNACPEWEVEVKQARCGYYWCGDHSYTSVEIPCGSSCQYGDDGSTCQYDCDCEGGDDFTINGHSGNFTVTKSACSSGTYEISLNKEATFSISGDGLKINGSTSGTLDAGRYNISFEGVSEGQTVSNDITFTHESTTIVLTLTRKCSSELCDCRHAHINVSTNSVTLSNVMGDSTNVTYSSDCALQLRLDNTADFEMEASRGNIKITTKNNNPSQTPKRGNVQISVADNPDDICTSISITQEGTEACKLPDAEIDIMLSKSNFSSEFDSFALTNKRTISQSDADWIIREGERPFSIVTSDVDIALYVYNGCDGTINDDHTVGYNDCDRYSVKKLEAEKTYYLYGFRGNNYTFIRSIRTPDGETANNGADETTHKYYIQ